MGIDGNETDPESTHSGTDNTDTVTHTDTGEERISQPNFIFSGFFIRPCSGKVLQLRWYWTFTGNGEAMTDEEVEELITDMDNDNDGKIGHEEFMEVLTKK